MCRQSSNKKRDLKAVQNERTKCVFYGGDPTRERVSKIRLISLRPGLNPRGWHFVLMKGTTYSNSLKKD